jgi:hypothetical protein
MFKFCTPKARKVFTWLAKHIDANVENYVGIALHITGKMREFLQGDIADTILRVIPTDRDDRLVERIRIALDIALDKMLELEKCTDYTTTESRLACYLVILQGRSKEQQDAATLKIAALITALLHDRDYAQSTYDTIVQLAIQEKKL